MTRKKRALSLQDILRRRQEEEFVGREEQLRFFQENLGYDPEDPRRRFVIQVSGLGGVGKTWLLRRFRKIAEELETVTAWTDENEEDVPGVMACMTEQFEAQGHAFKTFAERYRVYRQLRHEIETDPEAPKGVSTLVGRTLAKTGIRLARRVPIAGVAADIVDEEALASVAGDFAAFVARKISNKDEVRLVLEPERVLTPLFLVDLHRVAEGHSLALFLDTYDRTGDFLEPWLLDLLEGRHGNVPSDIVVVVARREELDRNLWASYQGFLVRLHLHPFTEEEARNYLARKGITDEKVVEVILRLSERLPILVATLAAESPTDPATVGDPSGEAVECFLKWVEDPRLRQVALDASLPRYLNRDVLAEVVGDQPDPVFSWLREMPFVEQRREGRAYHDVVRRQMLRYKRREAPKSWANLHGLLAQYYESLGNSLGLEEEIARKDETWQRHALEALYHRLCQAPQKYLPSAQNGFLAAVRAQRAFARRWAHTMEQAGEDADNIEVQSWGRRLVEAVKGYDEDCYQPGIEMATALLEDPRLEPQARRMAFEWRCHLHLQSDQYSEALADMSESIELAPQEAKSWAIRGTIFCLLGHYDEALADLGRAIELEPDLVMALVFRWLVHQALGQYDEALTDMERVAQLEPDNRVLPAMRMVASAQAGDIREAAATMTALGGQFPESLQKAQDDLPDVPREMLRRVWQALFARMGIDMDTVEAVWELVYPLLMEDPGAVAEILHRLAPVGDAADISKMAAELDASRPGYWVAFGRMHYLMKRYDEALAHFDRAIGLAPDYVAAFAQRGMTYLLMGRYEEALTDFDRAIELQPDRHWHFYRRSLACEALGRKAQAHDDLASAIRHAREVYEKDPQDWPNTVSLGLYNLVAGEPDEAQHLYQEFLSSTPSGDYLRRAIDSLDDLLALFPDHSQAPVIRDLLQAHLDETTK